MSDRAAAGAIPLPPVNSFERGPLKLSSPRKRNLSLEPLSALFFDGPKELGSRLSRGRSWFDSRLLREKL